MLLGKIDVSQISVAKKPVDESQINKINREIDKKQNDIEDTAKEMQKAIVNNEIEKGQLLQNKMLMKQQEVQMMQMQIKDIREVAEEGESEIAAKPPRVDRYIKEADNAEIMSDNVYRVEMENGTQRVIFNQPDNSDS